MKKIIKLTESDLSRIVKRVIKEEDEMESRHMSITMKDVFDEVVNSINEYDEDGYYNPKDGGLYDESMKKKAIRLSQKIMGKLQDHLALTNVHYEADILDILGKKGDGR